MHPMLNIAVKAARKAGSIINRASIDVDLVRVSRKQHNDFVTEVDRAAEAAIIDIIRTAYPEHAILAEESGQSWADGEEQSEFTWVIDPLDGTTNFIHGFPQYAVSIGLLHKGVPSQAVVYDPTRDELFTASKGAGAVLNNRRIRVTRRDKLADCLIGTGFPFRDLEGMDEYLEMFALMTRSCAGLRRPGAAALDLAYVACGRLDGFFERGLGGLVDLSNHNTLGKARIVGIRSRYDSQVREVRGYFNQPALKAWPVETTLNVYLREERNPETERTGRFDIDRRGISVQQERELRNRYLWSYGFRYERARSFDPLPGGLLDERVTVAPLSSTFTRETRDEVLDATRGAFLSHAFQYSPSWLGADQGYVKYFGQYFRYVPLQPLRRERFTGEVLRPRLVLAGGARLGLAHAFDGALPLSERFFAGGSTTLRGFEQNAVGPVGADRIPLGGEAMLVLNGELRFPLIGIFDGAAFVDVGNVFRDASDFALSDLRESGGIGIRVRTPWFLGRVDYGVPFDRRPGEARSRLYFSIGQAF